jgi:hypothetical protein
MDESNLELKGHSYDNGVRSPLGFRIWTNKDDSNKLYMEDRFDKSITPLKSYKQGLCIGCWSTDLVSQYNYCAKCDIIPHNIAKQLSWYKTRLVYSVKSDTIRLSESFYGAGRIELRIRNYNSYISELDVKYSKNEFDQLNLTPLLTDSDKIQYDCHLKMLSYYDAQNECLVYIDHITSQYGCPADVRRHIKYVLARIMLCSRMAFAPWSLNDIKG